VKASPCYGNDTNSVILTPPDWPQRSPDDTLEKLMEHHSTLIVYTMLLDYPKLFAQLARHYPQDTPVAVVCYAGDEHKQQVIRSTVGRFLQEVDYAKLPREMHTLAVGKFLTCGQARRGGVATTPGDPGATP
jgi:precorrin-4 methylase